MKIRAIVILILFAASVCVLPPAKGRAEKLDRVVQLSVYRAPAASPFEAVEVVDVKVKGESIRLGAPFQADEDWLSTLRFRVKNISGSTIVNMRMALSFPELQRERGGELSYLAFALLMHDLPQQEKPPGILMPDEEMELGLAEGQYKTLRRMLGKDYKNTTVTRVLLRANMVVRFEKSDEMFCAFRLKQ